MPPNIQYPISHIPYKAIVLLGIAQTSMLATTHETMSPRMKRQKQQTPAPYPCLYSLDPKVRVMAVTSQSPPINPIAAVSIPDPTPGDPMQKAHETHPGNQTLRRNAQVRYNRRKVKRCGVAGYPKMWQGPAAVSIAQPAAPSSAMVGEGHGCDGVNKCVRLKSFRRVVCFAY